MYKKRIKKLRENLEVTQIQVAKVLGIYKGLYNQYENEYVIIPTKHLNTLLNYFNVSIDYIFSFTDIKMYKNYSLEIDYIKAGQRLKEFRKNHNITQTRLAQELNTVQPVIANYEKGKHLIATPFLYTICKKYKISADYLLGKVDDPIYFLDKEK